MALDIKNENLFNKIVSDAIEKAMTNCKTDALAKRWTNAIERAVTEIQENPFLNYDTEKNELLILSPSTKIYSANGVCQCLAYENGHPCWHRAAARLVRLYLEAENTPPPAKAAAVAATSSFAAQTNAPYIKQEKGTRTLPKVGNIRI